MPLSEFTIRHARITGKNYTLCDFDGLSLWVTKAGSKLWLFRYYWEGRQQRMSFGAYPEVSLKQARERRDEARKLIARYINPCEHRKQKRIEAEAEVKQTFQAVYDGWIAFRSLSLKEGRQTTLSQILRVFKKDILPTLAERPIKSITRHDLWAQGKHEAASSPLTIRLEGTASLLAAEGEASGSLVYNVPAAPKRFMAASDAEGDVSRPPTPGEGAVAADEPVVSDIQRERLAMLAAYEAPTNLTVPEFARLAGKSREQVSREIKAGRLLAISLGNRGFRVPDWQLDSSRLAQTQEALMVEKTPWDAFWVLSK